jgi:excisionase family DNA binding protein
VLTAKQAAQKAGVSLSLIYQWCHEGRLPHSRLGGRDRRGKILIDTADLDFLLASMRVTPTSENLVHIRVSARPPV